MPVSDHLPTIGSFPQHLFPGSSTNLSHHDLTRTALDAARPGQLLTPDHSFDASTGTHQGSLSIWTSPFRPAGIAWMRSLHQRPPFPDLATLWTRLEGDAFQMLAMNPSTQRNSAGTGANAARLASSSNRKQLVAFSCFRDWRAKLMLTAVVDGEECFGGFAPALIPSSSAPAHRQTGRGGLWRNSPPGKAEVSCNLLNFRQHSALRPDWQH